MGSDSMLTRLFRQRAPQVGLPGTGEALEHIALLTIDERTCAQLGKDMAVQSTFIDSIHSPQIRLRVTQPSPSDQALDLGMVERRVSFIDDQPQPVIEAHSQHQALVFTV